MGVMQGTEVVKTVTALRMVLGKHCSHLGYLFLTRGDSVELCEGDAQAVYQAEVNATKKPGNDDVT